MNESDMNFPVDLETAKNRVLGDMEFLKEMLVMFEESIPAFLQTIRDAIMQFDGPTLSRTAHQLKGAAFNLSVLHIAQKAAELDEIGKDADFEKAGVVLKELELAVTVFSEFMAKGPWESI